MGSLAINKGRWLVLSVFALSAAMSQALWLNFAPLIVMIEEKYKVTEDVAGLLLLVFPLIYVLISIPAGRFIDQKGYRKSMLLGGLIMAVFSIMRIFDSNFWVLLAAQTGIAIAQPFIINSISKLVLDWFEKDQEAIATGIGTAGMFIGMALGMMATPILVEKTSFQFTMLFFAALSIISIILNFLFIKSSGLTNQNTEASLASNKSFTFKEMLKDKNLLLIFTLAFLGLGFFNGLTTWLEPILAPAGISSVEAGVIGGMLIIGGIFGAGIIPTFSDFVKKRKPMVVISIIIATVTLYPLCNASVYSHLIWLATIQGFFFLPAFSLLLQMCAEHVGEARAGIAIGVLMLLGNAGGVIVIIAMEAVKSNISGFKPAVHLMFALLLISSFVALLLKETYLSQETLPN
jgi:predicted MFS family arabinose efflux permease